MKQIRAENVRMMLKRLRKKMAHVPDFDQTIPLMMSIMHDWGDILDLYPAAKELVLVCQLRERVSPRGSRWQSGAAAAIARAITTPAI
jgi:hypothetical protein